MGGPGGSLIFSRTVIGSMPGQPAMVPTKHCDVGTEVVGQSVLGRMLGWNVTALSERLPAPGPALLPASAAGPALLAALQAASSAHRPDRRGRRIPRALPASRRRAPSSIVVLVPAARPHAAAANAVPLLPSLDRALRTESAARLSTGGAGRKYTITPVRSIGPGALGHPTRAPSRTET